MYHSLLWGQIALLMIRVYSRSIIYHWNRYDEEIPKSVDPSAYPSICNANKNAYSFIITSRIVIRVSDERALHPLQENEVIFSRNTFHNFRPNLCKCVVCFLLLLVVEWYFAYQVKGMDGN